MKLKKAVFWVHLCCGVAAGVLILLMSVTGVLLAYEKQLVAHAETRNRVTVTAGQSPMSLDALAAAVVQRNPAAARGTLVVSADPADPVRVNAGRGGAQLFDPYTGASMENQAAGTQSFLRTMENWHRWLGGSPGGTGAALMHLANLLFLGLVVTGIYVWLPDRWRWPAVRARLLFNTRPLNSKVRDFNWHHVFSAWALVPLFVVALSGVVMSYEWANNLVYTSFGEQPPVRRAGPPGEGPPGGPGGGGQPGTGQPGGRREPGTGDAPPAPISLDAIVAAVRSTHGNWQSISMPVAPSGERATVNVTSRGDGARQAMQFTAADGQLHAAPPAPGPQANSSPGARARRWFRFAHTGEEYGVTGQTVAALASLAACFLVYTGLALAWRRLIVPLIRRPA